METSYKSLDGRAREMFEKLRNLGPSYRITKEELQSFSNSELLKRKQYIPNGYLNQEIPVLMDSNIQQYLETSQFNQNELTFLFGLEGVWNTAVGVVGIVPAGKSMKILKIVFDGISYADNFSEKAVDDTVSAVIKATGSKLLKDANGLLNLKSNIEKMRTGLDQLVTAKDRVKFLENFKETYARISDARAKQFRAEEETINNILSERGFTVNDSSGVIQQANSILEASENLMMKLNAIE